MLDLNDLYFFAQVVERKGVTAAARALNVPKSNLSRRLIKLEQALGARLITRTSRRFVVTEVGVEFYHRCRAVAVEAEEAANVVRRKLAEPVGRVRFSCPTLLAQHVVADLLPRFMRDYPKVEIAQHLPAIGADMIEEGFDLALRVHGGPLQNSDLIQRVVCPIQLVLVASPAFLDRVGRPRTPGDFAGVAGLARDVQIEQQTWTVAHEDGRRHAIGFRPVFSSNDWLTLRKIAAAGFGAAAVPAYACRDDLREGTLERVLPDWRFDPATLSLLTPSRRGTLPSVRALIDFLLREIPAAMAL